MALTRLEKLEQELADDLVQVFERPMSFDAITLKIDNPIIIMDNSRYHTQTEQFVALYHEKKHIDYPKTLYDVDTSLPQRKNKETRTDRRVIKELLPIELLHHYYDELEYTIEMIAEELDLPEGFIRQALQYYAER